MNTAGKRLLIILGLAASLLLYPIKDSQISQAKTDPILNLLTTIEVGGAPDAIVVDYYGNRNDVIFYDREASKVRFLDGNTLTLLPIEIPLPTREWGGWMVYDHFHHHAYALTKDIVWNNLNWNEVTVNVISWRQLANSFSANAIYNEGIPYPPDTFYTINGLAYKQPNSEGNNLGRLLIDNARSGNFDVIDLDPAGYTPLFRQRFSYRSPIPDGDPTNLNRGNTLALEIQHETQNTGSLATSDVVYIADKNRPWLENGYGYLRTVRIEHYPELLNATLLSEVVLDQWPFSNGIEGLDIAANRDRLYVASAIQSFDDGYVGVVNTTNNQLDQVISLDYHDPGFVHVDWYDPRRVFVVTYDEGYASDQDQGLYLKLIYDDVVIDSLQLLTGYDEYNGLRGMVFDPYTNRLYLTVADTIMVVEVNYGAPPAPPPLISTTATITVAGGSLVTPDEAVQLDFPTGAVSSSTTVTYTESTASPAGELYGVHFFELTAVISGTTSPVTSFNQPYTVTVNYSPSEAGPAIDNTLGLYWWDGFQWVREPTSSVDVSNQQVVATPDHMTLFAVLGETRRVLLPMVIQ